MTFAEAMEELARNCETQFDRTVVDAARRAAASGALRLMPHGAQTRAVVSA
jgi:hypothetical protein